MSGSKRTVILTVFLWQAGGVLPGRAAEPESAPTGYSRCGAGECGPGTKCIDGKKCPRDTACAEFPLWCLPAEKKSTAGEGYPPMKRDPWRALSYRLSPDERAELDSMFRRFNVDQREELAKLLVSLGPGDGGRIEPFVKDLEFWQKKRLGELAQRTSPCGRDQCPGVAQSTAPLCYGDDTPTPAACERQLDGTCGWGVPRCPRGPETCRSADCGPIPMMGWRCPDATMRGFGDCIHQINGRCAWKVLDCAADCGITLTGSETTVSTLECRPGYTGICGPDHRWSCQRDRCLTPQEGSQARCPAGQEPRWSSSNCSWHCLPAGDECAGRCRRGEECRVVAAIGVDAPGPSDGRIWGCVDLRDTLCKPNECGPRPGLPNWQCFDGSLGGPGACVRAAAGKCYWKMHLCSEGCTGDRPACVQSGAQCVDGVWACPGDHCRGGCGPNQRCRMTGRSPQGEMWACVNP